MTITVGFVIEITIKLILIFKEFIKSKLELFDAFIVYSSFIVEMIFLNTPAFQSIG